MIKKILIKWLEPEINKMIREKVVRAKHEMHMEVSTAINPVIEELNRTNKY